YMNIFVQPQYVHMFGLPDDAVSSSPNGPLGMGGLYYLHNKQENPYKFGVHQAYLQFQNILDQSISLKAGRFEYCDGLEVLNKADGKKFNTVKKMRLADRLISSFGWSAFSRSFDGGLFSYDNDKINFTSSFFYPTQGGWEKGMNETIEDIKITTATLTAKQGVLLSGVEIAGFYYNYKDDRNVTQRIDNSGISTSADGVNIDIHMIGGHLLGVYDLGPGQLDVLLWGGGQFGDWYELSQQAYAVDGEIGYQFTKFPWKPWLRMGYFMGSGDDNAGDDDHGTFFQMAPGTRKYELLPFCDLMNTQDLFFQIITKPLKKLTLRADYHFIWLTESKDKWYMGSGPTQEEGSIFGYLARPTNGEDDLAQELDLIVNYAVNPQCNIVLSYSHIFGKDVIEKIYPGNDDADYVSMEMQLKF
ncbi:MAG: alginate export family protein, partial [Candidatus Susulua stagnicola]|nr:alginate export family protein [Candidatus Susulua stagnicola]